VTKADEGVAPTVRGTAHIVTPGGSGSVGVAELTHELVRGQLSEYIDGSLGESDRRRVDGHLASCAPCTAYLNTLRATVQALGKLPAPQAPTRALRQIVEQARRESDANQ
jgi:anti-sigma factor RsiW